MSAKNRGTVSRRDDCYETPTWLVEAIMPVLVGLLATAVDAKPLRILEPACSHGRIVRAPYHHFPGARIDAGDISPEYSTAVADMVQDYGFDFLTHPYAPVFDLIITNPPFSLAREFCQRALELRRTSESVVAMLTRVNFLGARKRAGWWREVSAGMSIYITPRRPSFREDGKTDATEYCWLVWSSAPVTVQWLETEGERSAVKRRPKKAQISTPSDFVTTGQPLAIDG